VSVASPPRAETDGSPPGPARATRGPSLSLPVLKRLSFTHSTIYACLLAVWLIPGLASAETVFGFAHGLGWIAMVGLILVALRARVVSMRSAVAVAVLGGIGPFFGSYELAREQRDQERAAAPAIAGETHHPQPPRADS
jgi:hypothetical protein